MPPACDISIHCRKVTTDDIRATDTTMATATITCQVSALINKIKVHLVVGIYYIIAYYDK